MGTGVDMTSVWQSCIGLLKERVSKEVFETWFKDITIGNISENEATIRVQSPFFRDYIREHYQGLLEEVIGQSSGKPNLRVVFAMNEGGLKEKTVIREGLDRPAATGGTRGKRHANLNPRYTFSNFVAAPNNQLARAASMKVAETPGTAYNPLLLYGGVGLGKTHLMQAIGNAALDRADIRIAYVTSEQFTNEVINGIRYDRMVDVRRRYRNIDMLLVDDIQ